MLKERKSILNKYTRIIHAPLKHSNFRGTMNPRFPRTESRSNNTKN